jgi:copper chaperone
MFRLHVPAMKCGGCASAVARSIKNVDAAARIETDLESREVKVASVQSVAAILTALREAGYPSEPVPQPLG